MLRPTAKANQKQKSSELIQFELTKNSFFNEKVLEDDLVYSDREDDFDTKENFQNLKTIAICEQLPIKNNKKVVVSKIITFRLGRDRYDIRALRDQLRK